MTRLKAVLLFLFFVSLGIFVKFIYDKYNIAGVYTNGELYCFEISKSQLIKKLSEVKRAVGNKRLKCNEFDFKDGQNGDNYIIYFHYSLGETMPILAHKIIVREKWDGRTCLIYEEVYDSECYPKVINHDINSSTNNSLLEAFETKVVPLLNLNYSD